VQWELCRQLPGLWPFILRKYFENNLKYVFVLLNWKVQIRKKMFSDDFSFLACYAISTGKYLPTFRMIFMPSPSGSSSPRTNDFYPTRRIIPEDLYLQQHRCVNVKYQFFWSEVCSFASTKINIVIFRIMKPYSLVDCRRRFGGSLCLLYLI
jgi:hypothetical protein